MWEIFNHTKNKYYCDYCQTLMDLVSDKGVFKSFTCPNCHNQYEQTEWDLKQQQLLVYCKDSALKIEEGYFKCSKCDYTFIDVPNIKRLRNFGGKRLIEKLYSQCITPYKDNFHNRSKCSLSYKILPNSLYIEKNLNLLLEFFGEQLFFAFFREFVWLDELTLDTVDIYLTTLLLPLKKGYDAFNEEIIHELMLLLRDFLSFINEQMNRVDLEHTEQSNFLLTSIIGFFISVKDIDIRFIDELIRRYYKKSHIIGMSETDYFLEFENNFNSQNPKYTNQEIKDFLTWLRKRIMGGVQKQNIQMSFKIIVLGPLGGGKSAVCNYIMTNTYVESPSDPYKGVKVDFIVKIVNLTYQDVKLKLFLLEYTKTDQVLFSSFIGDALGIILVFDISDDTHLDQVILWLKELEKIKRVPIIIAANKKDLGKHKEVSEQWISNLKKSFNILEYIECSAKMGENIDSLFQTLYVEIIKNMK